MENKNNIPENSIKEAPFLSKMKKENHFSTPQNYFEVLPELIDDKKLINNILNISFDKLSWRILIPISSLAIILIIVFNLNNIPTESKLTDEQLSDFVINEEYINIDDYLIYDAYSEVLNEEEKTTEIADEYITYLMENDIDINSIIDEL